MAVDRRAGGIGSAGKNRAPCCGSCRFFDNDPRGLEKAFPGLTILGSAYGSSRGDAGLCSLKDLFLSPEHRCTEHEPKAR